MGNAVQSVNLELEANHSDLTSKNKHLNTKFSINHTEKKMTTSRVTSSTTRPAQFSKHSLQVNYFLFLSLFNCFSLQNEMNNFNNYFLQIV